MPGRSWRAIARQGVIRRIDQNQVAGGVAVHLTGAGSVNRARQWRGLATCHDKLAGICRAAVTIFAIITWLRP